MPLKFLDVPCLIIIAVDQYFITKRFLRKAQFEQQDLLCFNIIERA